MKKTITAKVIQDLRNLAEQIGEIIPATSFGNSFCFQKIAKDEGLTKLWIKDSKVSKKEKIYEFLRKVYKKHPRTFYKIFRENLAKGIERRKKNGNPVLKEEIMALDKTLKKLEVNLTKEIKSLDLPIERPKITPPEYRYQKILSDLGLHPLLLPNCLELFKDGHINDSVRKALEKFEKHIQTKIASEKIGNNLMVEAFDENNPKILVVENVDTKRNKGIQEGMRFLAMGSMGFWRNYCSHGDEKQMSSFDAIAIISTISHFLYLTEDKK